MLQSMTGYGKSEHTLPKKRITVEMRSLNSKKSDIYLRIPRAYKPYEIPIRKIIQKLLSRGKIECTITEEVTKSGEATGLNKDLILAYYKELSSIAEETGADKNELLPSILQLPEVMDTQELELEEDDWSKIQNIIEEVAKKLTEYRKKEGQSIKDDITHSINKIEAALKKVPEYENIRIDSIKERMYKSLEKLEEKVDENRLEQELIYYIEKLDINEEKSRLQQHIDYFRETMKLEEAVGTKLGFISQEMGREINTLGSKSYHADLQKLVVEMKNYLEKIKEQVLNAL